MRAAARRGVAEEKTVVTHRSAHIAGETINYTATAGTYVLRAADETPQATFFYVAYTKDGVADVSRRPISFVYNGGPGSASVENSPKRRLRMPSSVSPHARRQR